MKQRNKISIGIICILAIVWMLPVAVFAAMAGTGTPDDPYKVGSWEELQLALNAGGYIQLTGNISGSGGEFVSVREGTEVTLDLAGYKISSNVAGAWHFC